MNKFILTLLFFTTLVCVAATIREERVAVGVNGAQVTPGTYHVSPNQRILDVIKLSHQNKIPPLNKIDSRNIRVTNSNGTSQTYDLLRYINQGDLSQNPYIVGGQSIHIGFATEKIYLSGDIQGVLLGDVPLKKGETVADLLSMYTLNTTADTNNILIQKGGSNSKEYSLSELKSIQLEDLDGITIFPVKERKEIHRVTVSGEVLRPGIYTIEHNKSSAQNLIKQCGGPTNLGVLKHSWVLRKGKRDKLPVTSIKDGSQSIKSEFNFTISNALTSSDYIILPLSNKDILLEDGDEIIIPKKEHNVYISGQVKKPGVYPYQAEKDYLFYVELAGGFTKDANKKIIRVVEALGDSHRKKTGDIIAAGDIIMVTEIDKEAEFRKNLSIVQTILAIVSTATTLTLTYINLSKD